MRVRYPFHPFSTLGTKIAFILLVVAAVTGGAFLTLAHYTGSRVLNREAEAKADAISGLNETIMRHLMNEGKEHRVRSLLRNLARSGQVKEADITRPDGTIVYSADSSRRGRKLDLAMFDRARVSGKNRYRTLLENGMQYEYILDPAENQPECSRCHPGAQSIIGYSVMKVSTEDLRLIAREHRTSNIAMTAGSFATIGAITFVALFAFVVRPIRRMRRHIEQVEETIRSADDGETVYLSPLPELRGRDEISDLTLAFNELILRLNASARSLAALHESRLAQADRIATTGEMAAGIAHEIKNPIAGLIGALDIFDAEFPAGHPRREIVEEMRRQLIRVNQTVNDLLSYARPSPPCFEEIDLNQKIRQVEHLLSQQAARIPVRIVSDLAPDPPRVQADRKLIRQLLWNIMLNGIQAMDAGGTLHIASRVENGSFLIRIRDTGAGIAQEIRERIFTPFFTTKHKGTGLGLAISRHIVEQHHGTLNISETSRLGTTVVISLPLEPVIN